MIHESKLKDMPSTKLRTLAKALSGDTQINKESKDMRLGVIRDLLESRGINNTTSDNDDVLPKACEIKKASLPNKVEDDLLVARRYYQTFNNATKRGLEFNLTLADMRRLMRRKYCAYTGIQFSYTEANHMTLERMDRTIGYVKGNVVPVCNFANQLKNAIVEDSNSLYFMSDKQLKMFISTALSIGCK